MVKKVSKPRARKTPRAVRKTAMFCMDGPWKGHTLYLTGPNTLPMKVKGETGHYDHGVWQPAALEAASA